MRKSKFLNKAKVIQWNDRPCGMPSGGLKLKEINDSTEIYLYKLLDKYEGYAVVKGVGYDVLNNNGTMMQVSEIEYYNAIDC